MKIGDNLSGLLSNSLFLVYAIRLFWAIYKEKPEEPVVGVCLEGDTSLRLSGTLDLYKKGIINYIIVSGGVNNIEYDNIPAPSMKEFLVNNGVPSSIIEIDNDSIRTVDHPVNVSQIMKKHKLNKLLIITSGYHLVRAYLLFLSTFASEDCSFQVYGYPVGSLSTWFQRSPTENKYRISIFLRDELRKIRKHESLASLDFARKYTRQLRSRKSANS